MSQRINSLIQNFLVHVVDKNIVYYNLDIEHWKRPLDVKLEATKTRTVETFNRKSEINEA